ncbi:MAG: cytochrome c biogenesis protein ResB [Planctomycetota bacterium]
MLIALIIALSVAGAVLPQEGKLESGEIELWQQSHATVSRLLEPVGLFHVFHSWPFVITISLLGINTLTCTIQHFAEDGGLAAFKGPRSVEKAGFVLLHLCLLILFAGGFLSAATRLDGYIVLTEGQPFTESHDSYVRIVEGPLRREHHEDFVLTLKQVQTEYEKQRYQTYVTSTIEILSKDEETVDGTIEVNRPYTYRSISFTQDQTGFSPRIVIREKKSGRLMLDSFVALKTFQEAQGREYRDFLRLPFLNPRVIITFYPSYAMENGRAVKTAEEPGKPLLLIEQIDASGESISQKYVHLKSRIELGEYSLGFEDFRRWSSFKVVEDSGYLVVCVAMWFGLGALLLRYAPDLWKSFGLRSSAVRPDCPVDDK